MDSVKLETFLIAAKEGSFTRAAAKLFITPAAIKKQVDALEREVGTALFYRSAAGCSLTPAGEAFQKESKKVLRAVDRAIAAAQQAQANQHSELHVGHAVKLSYSFVSKLLGWNGDGTGAVGCRFERMKKAELLGSLRKGAIDCVLYINPAGDDFDGVNSTLVGRIRPYAVMRGEHPLSQAPSLQPQDLAPYDLYVSSVLDGQLFDVLRRLPPKSLRVLDAEDRNSVLFGLQHDSVIVFPSPVNHDRSVPLEAPDMDVRLFYLDETPNIESFARHVSATLGEPGIIIM